MTGVVILEGFQTGDNGRLLLVLGHVRSLNEDFSVSVGAKGVQCLLIVAGNDRNRVTVPLRYPECLYASRRYVYHLFFLFYYFSNKIKFTIFSISRGFGVLGFWGCGFGV